MKEKIILCSSAEFAIPFFEKIKCDDFFEITAVITQIPKKQDRNLAFKETEISAWAKKNNLKCLEIENFKNTSENFSKLNELKLLLKESSTVLLFAFGKLVPSELLDLPKNGWVNIHPSKLPLLRGPSPIQYAILNEHKKSALTLMQMNEKMDEGNIIACQDFKINENHNFKQIILELTSWGPEFILKNLKLFLKNKITPFEQDKNINPTYSSLIKKEDYYINTENPEKIINKIKAFGFVYIKIQEIWIKCFCAKIANKESLLNINGIEPIYLQKPGKKIMHKKHFLNGMKN